MSQEGVVINSPSQSDREDLNDTMTAAESLCEEQENPIDSEINEVM